jgi:hypothetical protein
MNSLRSMIEEEAEMKLRPAGVDIEAVKSRMNLR